jgi:hypothetical protein
VAAISFRIVASVRAWASLIAAATRRGIVAGAAAVEVTNVWACTLSCAIALIH